MKDTGTEIRIVLNGPQTLALMRYSIARRYRTPDAAATALLIAAIAANDPKVKPTEPKPAEQG